MASGKFSRATRLVSIGCAALLEHRLASRSRRLHHFPRRIARIFRHRQYEDTATPLERDGAPAGGQGERVGHHSSLS